MKIVYKCYLIYLMNLFSKYFKTNQINCLFEIQKILFEENLLFTIPFSLSVTYELKMACYKMVIISLFN